MNLKRAAFERGRRPDEDFDRYGFTLEFDGGHLSHLFLVEGNDASQIAEALDGLAATIRQAVAERLCAEDPSG